MPSDINGSFFLQIQGLDQLQAKLAKISGGFNSYLQQAMFNVCTIIANDAKAIKAGSFKNQTGNLRRSIKVGDVSPTRGVVYTDQEYAAYVEMGTQPYTMYPKSKKALWWPGAPHPMRSVNRPGNKPYPYMEPAFRNNNEKILNEYMKMFQTLASTGL